MSVCTAPPPETIAAVPTASHGGTRGPGEAGRGSVATTALTGPPPIPALSEALIITCVLAEHACPQVLAARNTIYVRAVVLEHLSTPHERHLSWRTRTSAEDWPQRWCAARLAVLAVYPQLADPDTLPSYDEIASFLPA